MRILGKEFSLEMTNIKTIRDRRGEMELIVKPDGGLKCFRTMSDGEVWE